MPGVTFLGRSFFFQAEDGIRDADVTGVQTCALPILIATCVGIVDTGAVAATGRDAAGAAGREAGAGGATTFAPVSEPLQFATTRPVMSAVTITSAIPIAVIFHGFQLLSAMSLPP